MLKSILFAAMALVLFACQLDQVTEPENSNFPQAPNMRPQYQNKDASWLEGADPKSDAEVAIQTGDFRLLALGGRARSIPGIEPEAQLRALQCGLQILANSSDALESPQQHQLRKKLFDYARVYNPLVLSACLKKNTDN